MWLFWTYSESNNYSPCEGFTLKGLPCGLQGENVRGKPQSHNFAQCHTLDSRRTSGICKFILYEQYNHQPKPHSALQHQNGSSRNFTDGKRRPERSNCPHEQTGFDGQVFYISLTQRVSLLRYLDSNKMTSLEIEPVANPNQWFVIWILLLFFWETEKENWFKSFFEMIRFKIDSQK